MSAQATTRSTWARYRKTALVVLCSIYIVMGARIGYGGIERFENCLAERWPMVTVATLLWPLWWPAALVAGEPEGVTVETDLCTI